MGLAYLLAYLLAGGVLLAVVLQNSLFKRYSSQPSVKVGAIEPPELLNRYEVEKKHAVGTWQRSAYECFSSKMTSKRNDAVFPCIYATKFYNSNAFSFLFLPSSDLTAPSTLQTAAVGIISYLNFARSHPEKQAGSLIILVPNPDSSSPSSEPRTLGDYERLFWDFLKGLSELDTEPRAAGTSSNTESELWSFCFDGVQAFVAVFTPAYQQRQSRHMSHLTMVYQPRWVFERVLDTPAKRAKAVPTIRGLIDRYDHPLPHSPDLGNFGEMGKTESRQYILADENVRAVCPFAEL